jgi:gamma-glutamylputrescine synthase
MKKLTPCSTTFSVEVADYLERYPQTKHIDVYLNDINGIMRGKRLSVESMLSLEKGCIFLGLLDGSEREDRRTAS